MDRRTVVLGSAAGLALLSSRTTGAEAPPATPSSLVARLHTLAGGFDGKVGIAVGDGAGGWIAAVDGDTLYPQQSVGKLWTALAVFDAVDRGRLRLDQPVTVTRADMSVFHQPIQKLVGEGGYSTTIDGLLVWALAESDNAANDMLVRLVGGPASIRRALAARGLASIRAGTEERLLQSQIAGLDWRPEYSFGQAFWQAREKLPQAYRAAKLQAYIDDPEDGATPRALVDALARLRRGELLSRASTARFLAILALTDTGPARLPAGLGPGWSIAHKTGTGQDLGDLSTGYNDVGLLTAPNGATYAVAVMIAATRRPVSERQALMAAVARAVVDQHEGRDPCAEGGCGPPPNLNPR